MADATPQLFQGFPNLVLRTGREQAHQFRRITGRPVGMLEARPVYGVQTVKGSMIDAHGTPLWSRRAEPFDAGRTIAPAEALGP